MATQPPHGGDPAVVLIDHDTNLDRELNLAGWNRPDLCRQLLVAGADPIARADAGITCGWIDPNGALLKPPGPYRPNWADGEANCLASGHGS